MSDGDRYLDMIYADGLEDDIPDGWCDDVNENHAWTPGDLECRRCGADLSEWNDDAEADDVTSMLDLVRDYGDKMRHLGGLPASRQAWRAGDFQREADAVLAEIQRRLALIAGIERGDGT